MADVILEGNQEPIPVFEDEEFKVEIIDEESPDEKDEATLALEAKIAEMEATQAEYKAQIESLSTKSTGDAPALSALAEQLKKLSTPEAPKAPEVQTDFKALFESVDKNFYTSPSKSVVDVVTPIMKSMDKKYSDVAIQQAVNISKLTVLADDTQKGDYIKYKDEVEKIVAASPPSEKVYSEALKTVRAAHFDDILAEKVAAQVAEITEKAEAAAAQASTPAVPNTFTNATQVQQARAKNTMKITAGQQLVASKWAMTKGYDWNDPEEKKWVLNYLKTNGVI